MKVPVPVCHQKFEIMRGSVFRSPPIRCFSSLSEHIDKEIVAAMRAKDSLRLGTLRNVKTRMTNRKKEPNAPAVLDDKEVAVLIKQGIADLEKTIAEVGKISSEQATKLVGSAKEEKAILMTLLPQQASQEEVDAAIAKAIAKHNAKSVKDIRIVLGELSKEFDASKFDAKLLGQLVKQAIEKKKD